MGDLYDLSGRKITGTQDRNIPYQGVETPDGHFDIPIVFLSAGQYVQLVADIKGSILEEVLPLLHEQLELPLEV